MKLRLLRLGDDGSTSVSDVDLSRYGEEEILVVSVSWSPGSELIFAVQDRIQSWLHLYRADAESGDVTRILAEEAPTIVVEMEGESVRRPTRWVEMAAAPRWLADGSFLWLSDRSGRRQILRVYPDGRTRLLSGAVAPVRSIVRVDEDSGWLWFSASGEQPIERHAYRVRLDGASLAAVTTSPGSHRIALRDDGAFFLDRFSSVNHPPEVRLCRADGTVVRVVERAEIAALESHRYSTPGIFRLRARDGHPLDASLIRPPDFDPRRSYPVWLTTYSGPDAPTVVNRWHADSWRQFLAQQGYLVFSVNNRSSSAAGIEITATSYRQFGVQELRDLEDAVDWLTARPWADGDRVGITGLELRRYHDRLRPHPQRPLSPRCRGCWRL